MDTQEEVLRLHNTCIRHLLARVAELEAESKSMVELFQRLSSTLEVEISHWDSACEGELN